MANQYQVAVRKLFFFNYLVPETIFSNVLDFFILDLHSGDVFIGDWCTDYINFEVAESVGDLVSRSRYIPNI